MPQILETTRFTVVAPDRPHHSRENGGHVVLTPKQVFEHRYEMPLPLAAELMHLTMAVGEALTTVLRAEGLDVVRINYQDNGNWAYKVVPARPRLHVHLYVRTTHERHPADDPRFQAFPDALVFPDRATGYYDKFEPLAAGTIEAVAEETRRLLHTDKYRSAGLILE